MANSYTPPWVNGLSISEVLRTTARREAERDALVFPALGVRLSWGEFDAKVDEAARGLIAMGIQPGEHVAVWSTNIPEWVILQLATARVGVVLVTINPAYRASELKYVLAQCDAVALFLIDRFKSSDYFAMLSEVCPAVASAGPNQWQSAEFPKLRQVVAFRPGYPQGAIAWSDMIAGGAHVSQSAVAEREQALDPDAAVNIQYTSGTTGFPKAATLSHRNLLVNAFFVGDCQRMSAEDRVCSPVPLYHCFGCVIGVLGCVVYGSTLIVPAEYFQPAATLAAIDAERATVIYGVPTMYIAQLEDPTFPSKNMKSLRTGIMSGAPCPIEVMKRVTDKMGVRELTIAYGQTEASPVITQTYTDDPIELRVETVGRALPGVEVKIVDPSSGAPMPDNQPGELCARGHIVMLGYYKNEAATKGAIDAEGWLHTGDLAIRRPDGYFNITGRLKDMIIRGGENIYPREVEEYLFTHPAIEQVAVVGIPDKKYGEEVCAWIKRKSGMSLTEEEVIAYCKKGLAHFKTPRHIKFVDAFPQTVTGKIQKFKIRDEMREELKIDEQKSA